MDAGSFKCPLGSLEDDEEEEVVVEEEEEGEEKMEQLRNVDAGSRLWD